jgi:hypothetical protein
MKSPVLTLVFVLALVLQLYAQSFTKHFDTSEDEYAYTSINTPYGGYLIYIVKGEWDSDPGRRSYRDIILKTDPEGNILDSLVFHDNDSLKFKITKLIPHGDEFIIQGINYLASNVDQPVSYRIIRYSFDFVLQHDTTISRPGFYISCGSMFLNSAGHLMLAGSYTTEDFSQYFSFCKEMTLDGDSIRETIYSQFLPSSNIIELTDTHSYNLLSVNQIVEIDSNLNYVKDLYYVPSVIYPNTMLWLFSPKVIDGSTYIVPGTTFNYENRYEAAWGLFTGGNWGTVFSFGSVDTNDQIKGMDFITTERIYSSVSQMPDNFIPPPEFSQIDNQMLLYNTNINSSINWMKRYGGKGWIHAGAPLATSDGGCLWIGNYWDWHNKTHEDYDVIIMKINPDGSFFEGSPKQDSSAPHIVVYPNPGTDFEFSTDLNRTKLLLFNTMGMEVAESEVYRGKGKIETSNLKDGIYFYQLFQDNTLIDCGKWVKIQAH